MLGSCTLWPSFVVLFVLFLDTRECGSLSLRWWQGAPVAHEFAAPEHQSAVLLRTPDWRHWMNWSDASDSWLVIMCVHHWLEQKLAPTLPFRESVWHPWHRHFLFASTTTVQSKRAVVCPLCSFPRNHKTSVKAICLVLPLHYQMQLCLGVLDLFLGLYIQHVGCVFPIDLQDNVATLQVCLTCFAAVNDLFHRKKWATIRSNWSQVLNIRWESMSSLCQVSTSWQLASKKW